MAKNLNINIAGMDQLLAKLKEYPERIKKEVDLELTASATEMRSIAIRLAPADNAGGGGVRSKMFADTGTFLKKKVGNSSEIAAYIEFGTGVHAASYVTTLPKDWQAYAKTFFVNGKGRLPEHPFLFPAYEQERVKLIQRLKKILNAK